MLRAMTDHSTRGVLFLSAVLLVACKGEDAKQGACEQIVGCTCRAPTYASVDECLTAVDAAVDAARQSAEIEGLQFEQGCYDEQLARIAGDLQCRTPSEIDLTELISCPLCSVVHGDKAAGATCTAFQYGSDCADGLVCISVNGNTGVCTDVCNALAAGAVCVREEGDQTFIDDCAEGLRCDLTSRQCAPLLADGGLCSADADCVGGYCDSTGACTPARGEGQACDAGRCGEHLVCEMDACVAAPAEGQACPAFVCAAGSSCTDGTCVGEEALVCGVDFQGAAGM